MRLKTLVESCQDGFANNAEIAADFLVPKPQNTEALIQDVAIPSEIMRAVGMLRSVELDDETQLAMAEISEIGIHRHLPVELVAAETPIAQALPKYNLELRHASAERAGASGR